MPGDYRRTEVPAVYCTARKTNGDPCRKRPIKGGNVCNKHGGSAPQVRAAALRRIQAAADPAAATLVGLLYDKTAPHAVRLNAARDLLDRAGLTAKTGIEIDVGDSLRVLVNSVIAEVPEGWSAPDEFEPDPDYQPGEIMDAELVEEERPAPALPAPIPSSSRVPARIAERLGKGRH